METEIFKPITINPRFTRYEISNLGNVRSNIKGKIRILNPVLTKAGYKHVFLCTDDASEQKWFYVHRLVLNEFVAPISLDKEADHINNDKGDNRLENLQWLTKKQNLDKIVKKGRKLGTPNRPKEVIKAERELTMVRNIQQAFNSEIRQLKIEEKRQRAILKEKVNKIKEEKLLALKQRKSPIQLCPKCSEIVLQPNIVCHICNNLLIIDNN